MKTKLAIDELTAQRAWVSRLAYRMVRDLDDAEDVAQETYVAALTSPPVADRPARGWLARVATNVVRGRIRRDRRRSLREQRAATPAATPDGFTSAHRDQVTGLLAGAVDRLDEPFRTAIVLRFVAELSVAEVAVRQGVPAGTAGWRIHEGLKRLRAQLDQDAGGDARPWLMAMCPLGLSATHDAAQAATAEGGTSMFKLIAISSAVAIVSVAGVVAARRLSETDHETGRAGGAPSAARVDTVAPAADGRALATIATTPDRPAMLASRAAGAAQAGQPGAPKERVYQIEFRTPDGADDSARRGMLGDVSEWSRVLTDCFDAYYERSHGRGPGTEASVRIRIADDPGLGPIVADTEYVAERSDISEPEFVECLEASAFAIQVDADDAGAAGGEIELAVTVDPSHLGGLADAIDSCRAERDRRAPATTGDVAAADEELTRCVTAAVAARREPAQPGCDLSDGPIHGSADIKVILTSDDGGLR